MNRFLILALGWLLLLFRLSPALKAGPTAAELARQIQEAGLDPNECYRVIEQNLSKEDLRIFFTSGYVIFGRPVNGIRTSAVFSADVEGGDAEILLLPPIRSERLSLSNFAETPNLEEHFRSALLLFTDGTANALMAKLAESGAKKAPEVGGLLADKWQSVLRNLDTSFQVRQVEDMLGGERKSGLFYMAVSGLKLGNFDVICDPRSAENILVGQVGENHGKGYFNVWTSFASRSRRNGTGLPPSDMTLDNFRIDATLLPDLLMKAVTRVTVKPGHPARAFGFQISQQMRVLEATVDGQPAEVFARESLRSTLIQANNDQEFLVVTPNDLDPAKTHEFEFHHQGTVIEKAGEQVYYVGSRATWYPRRGYEFARYDLTFRYPKGLGFVATGDIVEDRVEGETRITRRKMEGPMRFAAFNLGDYKSISISHGPYKIEVYANRELEAALKPKPGAAAGSIRPGDQSVRQGILLPPPLPPQSGDRLQELAKDVASAFDYMVSQFGPPPIKTLTVSPIPGTFGQGFPGLLYLSTLAYLDPAQRPGNAREQFLERFFSDLLDAHEIAHQWWGNMVVEAGYQDGWLMEALANYSALLYVEKKKGSRAMETLLDDFRNQLLEKAPSGRSLESAGPITWGYRLESSQSPDAWHHIIYDKGTWVMHMLRRRMGDDRFLAMLRMLGRRYEYKPLSTDHFRQLAAEFMPPNSQDRDLTEFFDTWVYGTGIPALKLNYATHGLKVTGTVSQSDVAEDFSARIPIEITSGHQRTLQWVTTSNEPAPFTIVLKSPAKIALASKDALITVKR